MSRPRASTAALVHAYGPDVTVSRVRVLVDAPRGLGVQPVSLELYGCKEPAGTLAAALAAGWARIDVAADPSPSQRAVAPRQRVL